jgi:hypothetical protein
MIPRKPLGRGHKRPPGIRQPNAGHGARFSRQAMTAANWAPDNLRQVHCAYVGIELKAAATQLDQTALLQRAQATGVLPVRYSTECALKSGSSGRSPNSLAHS